MADNRPIGLFDSGVGGLSVLIEIKKFLPKENLVFLADQKNVPYGQKTKSQLQKLGAKIANFLLEKHNIKLLIIACNTSTCYSLDYLRSKFKIPIVGTVPAVKPAAALTKKAKIAVMSTPATAKSPYLASLVKNHAIGLKVLKIGCEGLEEAIENLKGKEIRRILDIYGQKIKKFGADIIVLGCTHYPFIKNDFLRKIGSNIWIIDSGPAIAKRVKFILAKKNALGENKSEDLYYTTGEPKKFSKVASHLLKYKITAQKANL